MCSLRFRKSRYRRKSLYDSVLSTCGFVTKNKLLLHFYLIHRKAQTIALGPRSQFLNALPGLSCVSTYSLASFFLEASPSDLASTQDSFDTTSLCVCLLMLPARNNADAGQRARMPDWLNKSTYPSATRAGESLPSLLSSRDHFKARMRSISSAARKASPEGGMRRSRPLH